MAVQIEVDADLASKPLDELRAILADEAAKGEALKREQETISAEVSTAAGADDVEKAIELARRRAELPVRLRAGELRRAQIQTAVCALRIREGEPALEKAARELESKEKALAKAQESRDTAYQSWFDVNSERDELARRMRELAMSIRDLRGQQVELLRKVTA